MKSKWNFIFDAFGFENLRDLNISAWHVDKQPVFLNTVKLSAALGLVGVWVESLTGYHPFIFIAFAFLIALETHTGIRVSRRKGQKFQSRKFGRMFLKLGYYLSIIVILNVFNKHTEFPEVAGFEIDPFTWLYHAFSVAIVFQLFISVNENLGKLGYKESKGIVGILTRRFNKMFDLEGDEIINEQDNGENIE